MAAGKGQIFETWSLQNQDLVQAAAHSYGERIVSETMNRLIFENSDVAESLDLVYRLHALNTIQNNLSTLTMSDVAESLDLVYSLHALNTIQNNLSTLTMSDVI